MVLSDLVDFIHPTQIKIDKECTVEGRGSEKSKMAANLSVVSGVHSDILFRVGRGKGSKSLHCRSGRSLIHSNALLSFLISRAILKVLNIKIKRNLDERQCQIRYCY